MSTAQSIIRKCRVCGTAELESVTMLPNYPLVAGPVVSTPKTVPVCDLVVGFCRHCGVCILLNTDADELVYDDDYTSSNIAYGYIRDMDVLTDRFADFIGRADKPQGSHVLEIGCYDGLFMALLERRYGFSMLGCEPCAAVAAEAGRRGHNVQPATFNAATYDSLDMIVARNVLEHIPSPTQFVEGVATTLKQDGALAIEVPTGERCIRNGILGAIVPEHPCYYGKVSLKRLLDTCFARVVVEEDGAVLRALASSPGHKVGEKKVVADIAQLREGESARQTRYDIVREASRDRGVDIFGANTCALELIAAGTLRPECVGRVYDDDPRKWGRYLVNTDLVVSPRTVVEKGEPRRVIVCSYTHRQSIAAYLVRQGSIAIKLYGGDE